MQYCQCSPEVSILCHFCLGFRNRNWDEIQHLSTLTFSGASCQKILIPGEQAHQNKKSASDFSVLPATSIYWALILRNKQLVIIITIIIIITSISIITPSSCPISFSCLALSTPVVLNVSSTCMWSLWDQGLSPLLCSLQYPQFYKHDQHPVMLSEYFLTGILYHFISKIILPSSQESWLQSSVCWPRHKTQTLPLFVKNKH